MFSRLLNLFRRRPHAEIEDELEWVMPPSDPLDGPAWDRYWDDQIQHGFAWMFNMFCDDGELIPHLVCIFPVSSVPLLWFIAADLPEVCSLSR